MKLASARFNVGQIVYDNDSHHRGVVCDVDVEYNRPRHQRRTTDSHRLTAEPWYHVLMDGSEMTAYIAQSQLTASVDVAPINHPLVQQYFKRFENGIYRLAPPLN